MLKCAKNTGVGSCRFSCTVKRNGCFQGAAHLIRPFVSGNSSGARCPQLQLQHKYLLLDVILKCPSTVSSQTWHLKDKRRLNPKEIPSLCLTCHSAGKRPGAEGWMLRLCSRSHERTNAEMQVGILRGFGSLLQDLSGMQSV